MSDLAREWIEKLCDAAHAPGELSLVQRVAISDAAVILGSLAIRYPTEFEKIVAQAGERRSVDLSVGRITYDLPT